ncbi:MULTISPECIES: hypothetical protein [Bradyrhizobium]|uniref:hypothetical protein n=1 Tax=Bradyrhizobium elkanii TaxID=29448 RepID=UPI000424EA43|nr:hypothetical protein [Bradyrhizobium elkanii]
MSVNTPILIGPFCAPADVASARRSDMCAPLRADLTETCILFSSHPSTRKLGQNGAARK